MRTTSRMASSRSSAPNSSGWRATSSQNLAYQPGNDQLPMTVAGSKGSALMLAIYDQAGRMTMRSEADGVHPVLAPVGATVVSKGRKSLVGWGKRVKPWQATP